jgi:hypothetical protein
MSFKRTRGRDTLSYPNPHRTSLGMSQPYHLPDSHPNSTNPRTVPIGMTNPGSQSTAAENNPSAERFGSGEEVQNLAATSVGVEYPVAFSGGENEVWQRDIQSQNEWIPGFGKMVSKTRVLILRTQRANRALYSSTTTAGSPGATRRLKLLFEDTQDHLRGHHNGCPSSSAADAEPT